MIPSRSDRLICFSPTKATHFETIMTTVDEVNSDKTKVPDEFIFCSVLLDCFTVIGMGGSWVVGRGSWSQIWA